MQFKDFQFRKNDKPRRWEDLTQEERECLCQQLYKQQKEEFERSFENGSK